MTETRMHPVALSEADFGLLRAGLAAHTQLMEQYRGTALWTDAHAQQKACHELSTYLGVAQNEAARSGRCACGAVGVDDECQYPCNA